MLLDLTTGKLFIGCTSFLIRLEMVDVRRVDRISLICTHGFVIKLLLSVLR
jgi:hypothetical protein